MFDGNRSARQLLPRHQRPDCLTGGRCVLRPWYTFGSDVCAGSQAYQPACAVLSNCRADIGNESVSSHASAIACLSSSPVSSGCGTLSTRAELALGHLQRCFFRLSGEAHGIHRGSAPKAVQPLKWAALASARVFASFEVWPL